MSWLRGTTDRLTDATSSLRSRQGVLAVLDALHGRWFGHAIHPPLSDLPIGLWTGSFLLDVAGRDEPANLLGAAGIAGGVAAFATGIADWSVTDGQDRRLALLHGLLNTAGLALQGAALTARLRGSRRQARTWSGAGSGHDVRLRLPRRPSRDGARADGEPRALGVRAAKLGPRGQRAGSGRRRNPYGPGRGAGHPTLP